MNIEHNIANGTYWAFPESLIGYISPDSLDDNIKDSVIMWCRAWWMFYKGRIKSKPTAADFKPELLELAGEPDKMLSEEEFRIFLMKCTPKAPAKQLIEARAGKLDLPIDVMVNLNEKIGEALARLIRREEVYFSMLRECSRSKIGGFGREEYKTIISIFEHMGVRYKNDRLTGDRLVKIIGGMTPWQNCDIKTIINTKIITAVYD